MVSVRLAVLPLPVVLCWMPVALTAAVVAVVMATSSLRAEDEAAWVGVGRPGVVGTQVGSAWDRRGGPELTQAEELGARGEGGLELCATAAEVCAVGFVDPRLSDLSGEQQAAAVG